MPRLSALGKGGLTAPLAHTFPVRDVPQPGHAHDGRAAGAARRLRQRFLLAGPGRSRDVDGLELRPSKRRKSGRCFAGTIRN